MSDPQPPNIRGALVAGPAAYALSRALDRDEIAERLDARGLSEQWREHALLALEAIDREALAWREQVMSASGRDSGYRSDTVASSEEMEHGHGFITIAAAADRLGYTARHVRRLANSGDLAGCRDGRDWQLDAAAVEHFARTRGER